MIGGCVKRILCTVCGWGAFVSKLVESGDRPGTEAPGWFTIEQSLSLIQNFVPRSVIQTHSVLPA